MKRVTAVLGLALVVGLIFNAQAQNASPDRSKGGNELTQTVYGSAVFLQTLTNSTDGGAGAATCTYVGHGFNVVAWCDLACYLATTTTPHSDGGLLLLSEMFPVAVNTVTPLGLLDNTNGKVCLYQAFDAGVITVHANVFRKY